MNSRVPGQEKLAGIGMTSMRVRAKMVERLRSQGIRDERVLAAMAAVPRHIFVEEALASRAYEDTALPLGFQQTISQPFIVARMIELLGAGSRPLGKTLEIGSGCGYQAAVLSRIATEVYSIERIAALLELAKKNLRHLRLPNVRLKHGDGSLGIPEAAPYDTIISAAAAPALPEGLLHQLADGGRAVLSLGTTSQKLVMVERRGNQLIENHLEAVRFVPLVAGVE